MKFDLWHKKEVVADKNDPYANIVQTERIGLGDFLIAGIIAVAVWTLQTLWALPIVHPANWADMAVAAGVHPAAHLVGGYYVAFASVLYRFLDINVANTILDNLGRLALCGIAIVVYATLREMLAFVMRARPQRSQRRTLVMQLASIVGTFAFIASDPVWRAGQYLGETSILLSLMIITLEFFFLFLRKGSLRYGYLCALFLGFLTAESAMGFLFLALFLIMNKLAIRTLPGIESPFFRPAVMAVSKWYLSAIFVLAILIGIAVNCVSFKINDGLTILGSGVGDLPFMYVKGYIARVTGAASLGGWIFWAGIFLAPFIVAVMRFPSAADEEIFLSYATGIVFVICALVAFTQVAPISTLWFWTHVNVSSDFLLALGILGSAVTLAASVTILGVDSLCRNHVRLAQQLYGVEDQDDDREASLGSPISTAVRRTVVIVIPVLILLAVIPDRMDTRTRQMLALVRDGLEEIVRETGDAKYLFTDGNLDTAIELMAREKGRTILCLPLVSMTATSARDIYLRTRGMENDAEDLFSFRFDTGMGLRSWIHDRPDHLKNSAVMMGFDLWKRDGKALPPFGGMLSQPCGWSSEAERQASVARANALSARILDIYGQGGKATNKDVKDAFLAVQWRLARMCTYRGEQADLRGDAQTAIAEADMAKRLNGHNETYKHVLAAMSRHNDVMMTRLTPREGLQLALVRADFSMGKLYAETILVADPENPDANFAMGMFYVKEHQLSRAEEYLKRCLIRRPKEPSIYNNLAMLQLELGKLKAAEINVRKALELLPDSAAVQDTLRLIEAKKNAAK